MKVIASVLIDKQGHIKWLPKPFNPNDADVCISNFEIGEIGKNSLFYVPLDYREDMMEKTCWTVEETFRRVKELGATKVKIFTSVQDFFDEINELQFAFMEKLEKWDEEVDMNRMMEFCKTAEREYLGEKNGIKFFRYLIKKS